MPGRNTHPALDPITLTTLPIPFPEATRLLDTICDTLAQAGHVIVPGFLSPEHCQALAAECREAQQRGEFRPAGVGRGEALHVRPEIRSDQIRWLAADDCGPHQAAWLQLLETYRQILNRQLYLGLVEFEGHCAIYPPGSFYQRHLDQFRGVEQRTVTAILYLNEHWKADEGGQLRIFLNDEGSETLEVLPEQGTLVTFLSANYWHEVLPARRERLSLTGWFKTRPPGGVFPLA